MSSTGTGYDLEASTFSPDGRNFQVEYATKAVDNAGTAIAMVGKDGVVVAVEKPVTSKLHTATSNPRIFCVTPNALLGMTGLYPDARAIAQFCSDEALEFHSQMRQEMPAQRMVERVAEYFHAYTLYGMVRPFGCATFMAFWDKLNGPALHVVEPNGGALSYKAWALGKNRQAAKTEMEKLAAGQMTCADLVKEMAFILHSVRDQTKDKNVIIEMGWIGEHTGGKSALVPKGVLLGAEEYAKKKLEEADSDMKS